MTTPNIQRHHDAAKRNEHPAHWKAGNTSIIVASKIPHTASLDGEAMHFREPGMPRVDFFPATGTWCMTGGMTILTGGASKFLKWYKSKRNPAQTVCAAPICPYCKQPAKLVDSATVYNGRSYGMIWDCRPCDAYVGVHKDSLTYEPLGRLANAELRVWKMKAHAAFNPLWESGTMSRSEAYALMQKLMGMTADEAHIGKFDVPECKKLIEQLRISGYSS